jgi:Formate hydrogenlyase subunit 6/NADH:ubiquinone oxidoreductase 23 kD subunit (chain I)
MMFNSYNKNTLELYPDKCIGCGMCVNVCPHAVFAMTERRSGGLSLNAAKSVATLARKEACIECGACQMNCPVDAVRVQSGVGCAAAMIRAALTGGPETCGDNGSCCGGVSVGSGSSCGSPEK